MCTFYVLTPTNPLILSGCDNLKLAPYNSTYPNIETHALKSGLTEFLNKWDKPIMVSHGQSTSSNTGINWIPLPVEDFSLFTVPVELAKFKFNSNSNTTNKKVFQDMVNKNESVIHLNPI
jgi:TBCC domain-containing protein 1